MINAKLKDAIAGGAHSIHVHPAVSSERSSGQGNQGDAANRPSVKFPDFSFPAVEFHGSSLFHRKSIESTPAEFMVSEGRSSGLTFVACGAGRQPRNTASKSRGETGRKSAGSHNGTRAAKAIEATHSRSAVVGPVGQSHPYDKTFLAMLLLTRTIRPEEPMFAGKVTSGVRNEISGQSWPSNTLATDRFTGDVSRAGIGTRDVLSDVSFEGSVIIRAGGSTHPLEGYIPQCRKPRQIGDGRHGF